MLFGRGFVIDLTLVILKPKHYIELNFDYRCSNLKMLACHLGTFQELGLTTTKITGSIFF